MDLGLYLYKNKITVKKFSEILECSRPHLSDIIHGRRIAGKRLAKDIEEATEGQVKAKDLLKKKSHDIT
jgi:DNA-binding transcriptional regulator YdaS (Cro superfamily)